MAINEFLPFGLSIGSNVMPQAAYAGLAQRTGGFSSGVAQSLQCNKVWRQSAFIASMVAQFTSDKAGVDMLDNGDVPGAGASFVSAISAVALNPPACCNARATAGNTAPARGCGASPRTCC